MSNALKITANFSATYTDANTVNTIFGTGAKSLGLTGSVNSGLSQSIQTSGYTVLNTGSVVKPGYYFLKNLETSSFSRVDIFIISASVTSSFSTLLAQEFLTIPFFSGSYSSSFLAAQSNISASVLQVLSVPRV